MAHKKRKGITYMDSGFVVENMSIDEVNSKHGRGKICSHCHLRKETKKVGSKFLCEECREKLNADAR